MFGWNRKYENFMFGWNGKYENLMKYKEWKMRKYENICREGIPWRGGLLVGRWWVEPLGHWVNNRPSWGGTHPCPHYICQLSRNYEDHPSGLLISAEYANWVLAWVWGVFLSNILGAAVLQLCTSTYVFLVQTFVCKWALSYILWNQYVNLDA